ncbi:hypothetical protein MX850_01945 [Erysipelothrix sp. Poltava]|nr:hypothetical protein MX850_01945 [Erysipelothrix sp. Poltava]
MTYFLMITIVAISISFFYGLSWFFLNREMIVLSHRKQTLFKFLGIFILIQVLNNYILEFTPGLVSSLMNRNLLYLIEGPVFAVQGSCFVHYSCARCSHKLPPCFIFKFIQLLYHRKSIYRCDYDSVSNLGSIS